MDTFPVGRTIVEFRPMTDKELEQEGWTLNHWGIRPPVLVFDDGSKMYPSMDSEGNGPGELFWVVSGQLCILNFEDEEVTELQD